MPDEEPSKNPFVRWKRHVDTHISTTLQGIVGLPSAISRNLNPRWPEVEETRRKEQERKQQQPQEERQNPEAPLSAASGPPQQPAPENKSSAPSESTRGMALSFFPPSQDRNHCPRAHSRFHSHFHPNPPSDGPGPDDSSEHDGWTSWPDWVQLARWHSFAAYSPYSPLNLRSMPQPRPSDLPEGESSVFTFEDAFEDLLVVMCGRELMSLKEKAEMRRVLSNMFPAGEPAFYWVRRLQAQNLLSGYFPRAEQVRRQLEDRLESEEEAQRQRELDEKRGRMWKWVWSRHHPMGKDDGNSDVKSFEEWDSEDWVKEMDKILSQAAKDVRDELNGSGHIFGELERLFKTMGKVGEAITGFGNDEEEKSKKNDSEAGTEEDYFSTLSKPSASAAGTASASTSSTSKSESADPFETWSKMISERHRATPKQEGQRQAGPFQNTATEESVDPRTGVRTVKTTEEKVDKKGNRTVRTEIRQLNSDGEEISRQTSYSKSMSASWSWSSGSDSHEKDWHRRGQSTPSTPTDDGDNKEKSGWFWR